MSNLGTSVLDRGMQQVNKLKASVSSVVSSWDRQIKEIIMQKKHEINMWIRKKVQEKIIMFIEKARPIAKQ